MVQHPDWKPEYRKQVTIKRMSICKSCRKRFFKDCCSEYEQNNKTTVAMVIGWQGSTNSEHYHTQTSTTSQ